MNIFQKYYDGAKTPDKKCMLNDIIHMKFMIVQNIYGDSNQYGRKVVACRVVDEEKN